MSPITQRVLLIDHSGTSLAIISKQIKKHIPNIIVDIATNAQKAYQFLTEHKYGLITTSRNLPDISYNGMIDYIRKDLAIKQTPLIVISGDTGDIYEEQLSCHYVNGYFDKKLGQKKLVDYIDSFLNTRLPDILTSGNILYVEDSATMALATKNLLSKHEYSYLHASNAEQALEYLQHSFLKNNIQPFDLLLTDIQLEGYMSGRDLIREIRHGLGLGYEQLPILVTTASNFDTDPGELSRIISAGANDILEKPIKEPMLITKLNNLLTLHSQFIEINSEHKWAQHY